MSELSQNSLNSLENSLHFQKYFKNYSCKISRNFKYFSRNFINYLNCKYIEISLKFPYYLFKNILNFLYSYFYDILLNVAFSKF